MLRAMTLLYCKLGNVVKCMAVLVMLISSLLVPQSLTRQYCLCEQLKSTGTTVASLVGRRDLCRDVDQSSSDVGQAV